MKYSQEIIINLPREKVVDIYNDPKNIYDWMEGLEGVEHISGEPGTEGAVSKMTFKTKRGTMVIEEEIKKIDLPDMMNFLFKAKGVDNWNDNRFESLSEDQTRWVQSNVFKFKGMLKIMGWLMPGAFKKQSFKSMNDFKQYAENFDSSNKS